jgi:hypothetical protein
MDLLTYIQRYELLAFFAGYPLLYTLVYLVSRARLKKAAGALPKWPRLLGAGYALVGTLFLVSLLWQASRPGSMAIFALQSWGVLAMLFWLRRLRRLPVLTLLHSLVFFGLIVMDIVLFRSTPSGIEDIGNDMRIFTISFLLNTAAFGLVLLTRFTVKSRR